MQLDHFQYRNLSILAFTTSTCIVYLLFPQLVLYQERREVGMLPEKTQSTHPIYTLFRDHEGGMVGMECQDEMEEMEFQEAKRRGETLVCRDYLAHKVCMYFD